MRSIEDLLSKDMSRKEFLACLGLMVFSTFGVFRFLDIFLSSHKSLPIKSEKGFGSGPYGGVSKEIE